MSPYAVLAGAVLGIGVALLLRELVPAPPDLGAALQRIEGADPAPHTAHTRDDVPWWERAGQATAERFAAQGVTPGKLGPEEFARRIAEDKVKFAEIVKRAGIEPQ